MLTTPFSILIRASFYVTVFIFLTGLTLSTSAAPAKPVETSYVQADGDLLVIPLGDIKSLTMPNKVTRIALGNGKIVSATTVDSTDLLLIAEQIGVTRLMVWTAKGVQSYRLQVVHPELAGARRLLQEIVEKNAGLQFSEIDSRIVISGVAHKSTIDQLETISKGLPGVLLNARQDEGAEASKSVLFRLHFIEVKKSLIENIGIQWNRNASGPVFGVQSSTRSGIYRNVAPAEQGTDLLESPRPFVSVNGHNSGAFFGITSTLASRINLGVNDGDVRVLASPELTSKSGGTAKLQVGGEVPIPMAGAFGATTVEFKPYGVIFNIATSVDVNGVITAKLATELSQIDPSVTVQNIPGFLTRSTSTEVSLRSGDVFALSGLLNGELSNSIDKVPGLGNIPILGRLFSSDDYRNNRTDLVVLVEAEIINSGSGMAEDLKQRGLKNIEEFRETAQRYTNSGGRRPLEKGKAPDTPSPSSDDVTHN